MTTARAVRSRPYRVLMSTDAVGGVWTYSLELARGLSRLGAEVALAVLGPQPSPAQRDEASGIAGLDIVGTGLPLDWTADRPRDLDTVAAELQALARTMNADIVHLNAPAHAGTRRWQAPLVTVAHSCVATWWEAVRGGPLPPDLAWRKERTRAGLHLADAVIAPSRSFAIALSRSYDPGLAVRVVHNSSSMQVPAKAGAKDAILTAGRLWDAGKNVAVIDTAAARSQLTVHAAGPLSGPHGEHIRLRNVVLLGSLDAAALARWYARTAVFVSMSRYEPFGLSVLEAARAGAALVLADVPTFRELWDGCAHFVAPDDARSLGACLARLGGEEALRNDLARRARARASRYSAGRQLARTLQAYRSALSARGRLGARAA